MTEWRAVGIVDNENMNVPHVLQQRYLGQTPRDDYRLRSISDLPGIEDDR